MFNEERDPGCLSFLNCFIQPRVNTKQLNLGVSLNYKYDENLKQWVPANATEEELEEFIKKQEKKVPPPPDKQSTIFATLDLKKRKLDQNVTTDTNPIVGKFFVPEKLNKEE